MATCTHTCTTFGFLVARSHGLSRLPDDRSLVCRSQTLLWHGLDSWFKNRSNRLQESHSCISSFTRGNKILQANAFVLNRRFRPIQNMHTWKGSEAQKLICREHPSPVPQPNRRTTQARPPLHHNVAVTSEQVFIIKFYYYSNIFSSTGVSSLDHRICMCVCIHVQVQQCKHRNRNQHCFRHPKDGNSPV